jgi:hypothetical protein
MGALTVALLARRETPVQAANDRFDDYIMCTGAVTSDFKSTARWIPATQSYHWQKEPIPIEGVWLLDYRSGKLLGTVVDRQAGKIVGWAEVDLLIEFGIAPRQDVHFTMTTGDVNQGQAALYLAELTSGRMGVYTMGPRPDGAAGVVIRRHDHLPFRQPLR